MILRRLLLCLKHADVPKLCNSLIFAGLANVPSFPMANFQEAVVCSKLLIFQILCVKPRPPCNFPKELQISETNRLRHRHPVSN